MFHEHHLRVARTARYVVAGDVGDRTRDAWFVLHGYGQLARRFARQFEPIVDAARVVVAPEALNRFYLGAVDSAPAAERPVGATWMTREDRDGEIADYVDYLDAVAEAVLDGVDRARVRIVVLGFSQGAATASRWAALGRTRADRLVLWGGHPAAELLAPERSHALRRAALSLVVGTGDRWMTGDATGELETRLRALAVPYRLTTFDGGHVIDRATLEAMSAER